MRFHLAVIALLALLATGCNSSTASQPESLGTGMDQLVVEPGNQITELIARVDRLEAEVFRLTAEVAPMEPGSSYTTTYNPPPFLDRYLVREIEGRNQLPDTFWEERLEQARLGLTGGNPTYEDVLAER